MPYASDKQRRFMWSQKPEIAEKFAEEGKGYVKGEKKGKKSKPHPAIEGLKKAKSK